MVGVERRLQVANVVDDVMDHLELGQLPVARHVRHQLLQLAEVHVDLLVLRSPVFHFAHAATFHREFTGRRRTLLLHHHHFASDINAGE